MRPALLTIFLFLITTCAAAQKVKVTHVSDGDSFIIAGGQRVRMIGVDAPELGDTFGQESKNHLTSLIRGKTVSLERDPLNDDRDIHGRLLRIVQLDGTDINQQMIADGYARALLRYRFARERQDAYREAEASARSARLGIWNLNGNSNPTDPKSSQPEANLPTQPPPVRPKSCFGTGSLLLLTFLAFILRRSDA